MTITSNVTNIYAFDGSLVELSAGGLLDAGLINVAGGPNDGSFVDNNGQLTQDDDGRTTFAFASGGGSQPIDYLGSGTISTATLLGIPLFARPVAAFQIGGQIYLYAPDGLPLLSGVLVSLDIDENAAFTLPAASNIDVDGLDIGEVMALGYTDLQGDLITTGADTIFGNGGNDTISADGGNDVVDGGGGNDQLNGDAGNDTLLGGWGSDTLNGGAGSDTASYAGSAFAVNVSLTTGYAAGGHALGDVFSSIENLTGSSLNDTLTGDNGANRLEGGDGDDLLLGRSGADTLDGGAGRDTASYAGSAFGINLSLASGYAAGGYALGDSLISIENVIGTSHNDTLGGDNGANRLEGGAGDDLLFGRGGADTLDGGAGNDTVTYSGSGFAVNVSLTTGYATGGEATGDTVLNVENLIGSGHDDVLRGNSVANRLEGGAGNDLLRGDGGADTLDGGAGSDTVTYSNSISAVNVSLMTGYVAGGHASGDVLISIENIIGSGHDDVLRGDNGANILNGEMGSDRLRGDGGADTFVFEENPDTDANDLDTILDFENGIDMIEMHISSIPGADFSDLIIGTSGADATIQVQTGTPGAEVTLINIRVLNAAGLIDASDFIFA